MARDFENNIFTFFGEIGTALGKITKKRPKENQNKGKQQTNKHKQQTKQNKLENVGEIWYVNFGQMCLRTFNSILLQLQFAYNLLKYYV